MKKLFALAFVGVLLFSGMAYALPIQWSGNGNWYEAVYAPDLNWADANDAAQLRTHDGVSGQLATLTSAEENAFVWDNFGASGYWLGASSSGGGDWSWVTGENWVYGNWSQGVLVDRAGQIQLGDDGTWNNYYSSKVLRIAHGLGLNKVGYIVEFAGVVEPASPGNAAHAPEPATMILLGTGLVGLAGMGRKKFKK